MSTRKNVLIAILITFCLTSMLFVIPILSQQGQWGYNPWSDINDDGRIDMSDIYDVCKRFGAMGAPVNKTELLINVNATLTQLLARINSLNSSLAELETKTENLNGSITGLQSSIDLLNSSLLTLEAYVMTKIAIVETAIALHDARIAELETDIVSLNSTITTLSGRLDLIELQLNDLDSTVDSLAGRVSALEADYSVTNMRLAPYAIPFNSTYSGSTSSTTETLNWVDISYTSVKITLNRTSHLLIMFSCEANNPDGASWIHIRAKVGSLLLAYPTDVRLTPIVWDYFYAYDNIDTMSYTFNFYRPSVSAGTYNIQMQWRVTGGTGNIYDRTLTVIALPS